MNAHRILPLATTLVLVLVEIAHTGVADRTVARLQQDQTTDHQWDHMKDPGLTVNPNMDLWVAMHGSSDKYVISHLKAAATRHGLGCAEHTTPGPRLQCHFQDDSHEAIFAYDEGETGLRVEVYYLNSAFEEIVHQFANAIKRSGKVRAIDWCGFPRLNCQSLQDATSGTH